MYIVKQFLDQIMKLNIENKNEMIKLIESLLGKEESEKEINLHNQGIIVILLKSKSF